LNCLWPFHISQIRSSSVEAFNKTLIVLMNLDFIAFFINIFRATTSLWRVWIFNALFFLIIISGAFAQVQDLNFRHLTVAEGLSQNTVSCILQDRQGYIWFGTWNGLNRY